MAAFNIIPGLRLIDRAGWGAKSRFPRLGRKVPRSNRTHVIIHHTVMTDSNDQTPNIWESQTEIFKNMRRLQVVRQDDLGADVPYNFVAYFVKKNNGVIICEGRGEDRTGAHTKGHNTKGIAISFAGNFEDESVSGIEFARRMHLISVFMGWLRHDPSHPDYGNFTRMRNLGSVHPPGRNVFIHRDFKRTACPGERLIPHLAQLAFIDPAVF